MPRYTEAEHRAIEDGKELEIIENLPILPFEHMVLRQLHRIVQRLGEIASAIESHERAVREVETTLRRISNHL